MVLQCGMSWGTDSKKQFEITLNPSQILPLLFPVSLVYLRNLQYISDNNVNVNNAFFQRKSFSANLIHSEVVFSHCFSLISTGSSVLLQLVMVKFLPGHVSFLTRLRQCDLLYGMYGERQLVVF